MIDDKFLIAGMLVLICGIAIYLISSYVLIATVILVTVIFCIGVFYDEFK